MTSRVYVLASSKEEAEELLDEGRGLCGACMADMLSEEEFTVVPSSQE